MFELQRSRQERAHRRTVLEKMQNHSKNRKTRSWTLPPTYHDVAPPQTRENQKHLKEGLPLPLKFVTQNIYQNPNNNNNLENRAVNDFVRTMQSSSLPASESLASSGADELKKQAKISPKSQKDSLNYYRGFRGTASDPIVISSDPDASSNQFHSNNNNISSSDPASSAIFSENLNEIFSSSENRVYGKRDLLLARKFPKIGVWRGIVPPLFCHSFDTFSTELPHNFENPGEKSPQKSKIAINQNPVYSKRDLLLARQF